MDGHSQPKSDRQILKYCESDTDALRRLLPEILPHINLKVALYRGESVAVNACMEHRGVPIDMEIFPRLRDKHAWSAVRDAMVPVIDAQYGVYVRGKDGNWSFNTELFEGYLARNGIDWPRLETGKLNLRRKTFENMCKAFPAAGGSTTASLCPRQDATHQAGGGR